MLLTDTVLIQKKWAGIATCSYLLLSLHLVGCAVVHLEDVSLNDTQTGVEYSPIWGELDANIAIPIREVLSGVPSGEEVRMAVFLFRNMSELLPMRIDSDEEEGR